MRVVDNAKVIGGQGAIDLTARDDRREIIRTDPVHHEPSVRVGRVRRGHLRGRVQADIEWPLGIARESAVAVAHRNRHFGRQDERRASQEVFGDPAIGTNRAEIEAPLA